MNLKKKGKNNRAKNQMIALIIATILTAAYAVTPVFAGNGNGTDDNAKIHGGNIPTDSIIYVKDKDNNWVEFSHTNGQNWEAEGANQDNFPDGTDFYYEADGVWYHGHLTIHGNGNGTGQGQVQ